ncbi:Cysteine-rich repeat secretory protein 56 [Capsicum annuum]|nr:Cysteine-rich repeat secretory protein 56 [Capsicum annuum]
MDLPTKPFCIFSLFLVTFTMLKLTPLAKSDSDYTKLVYKGCAKQDLSDPSGVYSQALSSLFGTLVSQSSKYKFYKTSTGSGQSTISGLFQCRGDLSNVGCYKCVSGLPILIDKLCGSKPVAARIQLFGCYMLYEVAGFPQISGMEMLFKTCSGKNAPGSLFSTGTEKSTISGLFQRRGDLSYVDCYKCVSGLPILIDKFCGSKPVAARIQLFGCYMLYEVAGFPQISGMEMLFKTCSGKNAPGSLFSTGSGLSTISGLFQRRGDLSSVDCYKCVCGLSILIDKLCGSKTVAMGGATYIKGWSAKNKICTPFVKYLAPPLPFAARIQLFCVLHALCGCSFPSNRWNGDAVVMGKNAPGSGFEERRDTAFSALENGMASSNGFYTANYQSVYTVGQCEGDVGSADCADCVKNAVQKAQVECGSSVSGQIFLHKCFIGYSNSPNWVPDTSPSSSDWSPSSSSGPGQNVGKTVAIIVGGVAGVGFILICVLFARNLMKKHDGEKELKDTGMTGSFRWFIFVIMKGRRESCIPRIVRVGLTLVRKHWNRFL